MVVKIFLAFTITAAIRQLVQIFWYEPRPFKIDSFRLLYPIDVTAYGSSFFSGHASSAFSIAGIIFCRYKKFGLLLIAGAALTALGRVLAGLHYPHDVIVGALAGVTISYLVERLSPIIARRFKKMFDI